MSRRDLILDHLRGHPGETSGEIGRALGVTGGSLRTLLVDMRRKGELVTADRWAPLMGRNVNLWSIAPPGTRPSPAPETDRERRRMREREAKRRVRAKGKGDKPSSRSGHRVVLPHAVPMPDLSEAACRTVDPDLFFSPLAADIAQARAVCSGCPITLRCAQWTQANNEEFGIWAGEDRTVRRLEEAS